LLNAFVYFDFLKQAMKPDPSSTEKPIYVNPKQYERIMKRRAQRERLEKKYPGFSMKRKAYLHESRHRHACNRKRGPGGRFLTKEEMAAFKKELIAKDVADAKAAAEKGNGGGGGSGGGSSSSSSSSSSSLRRRSSRSSAKKKKATSLAPARAITSSSSSSSSSIVSSLPSLSSLLQVNTSPMQKKRKHVVNEVKGTEEDLSDFLRSSPIKEVSSKKKTPRERAADKKRESKRVRKR
jgi:hypothetical protein